MGGDLQVETQVGKGTTFTVVLDLRVALDPGRRLVESGLGRQAASGERCREKGATEIPPTAWGGGLAQHAERFAEGCAEEVYKRQALVSVVAASNLPQVTGWDSPLLWGLVAPVSYTHLDVYKRQRSCKSGSSMESWRRMNHASASTPAAMGARTRGLAHPSVLALENPYSRHPNATEDSRMAGT